MSVSSATNAERKERAALISMFASAVIAVLKLLAALVSGSLALLSEAAHSLIDLGATAMTWFAVRKSEQPADDVHHYGHGKIEAVAALAETGLLFVLAASVVYEAGKRLIFGGEAVIVTWPVIAVLVVSIVIDLNRWLHLSRVAEETRSEALAADALHFSSDLVSSTLVLVGLGAVALGFAIADSLAAIAVAIFIVVAGYRLGRRTINTLMDAAPAGAADQVRAALEQVSGLIDIEKVRVRAVGAKLFVETTVTVPRMLPLDRVQAIKRQAAAAICAALPEAEPTVTAEPRAMDDESILERIILIAAKRRVPVHHVTVQTIGEKLSVSLDVEVDGRMSLSAAHQIASKLEAAIRDDLGPGVEVETHIEPLEVQGLVGEDVGRAELVRIERTIRDLATGVAGIGEVHSLRARQTEKGLVVTLHVRAEPQASVSDVHLAVDALERAAKRADPRIARIVTHAEPRK